MSRAILDESLEEVNADLLDLWEAAKTALSDSVTALKERDINRSEEIVAGDHDINELERKLNNEVVWLIAKERPIATDLRRLIFALKISNDLERIGDIAVNIAKANISIGQKDLFKPLEDIPSVADKAISILDEVIEAFQREDERIAKKVEERKTELDKHHEKLVEDLLHYMSEDPTLVH